MRIGQDLYHTVTSTDLQEERVVTKPAHTASEESWNEALVLHCRVMLFGILG